MSLCVVIYPERAAALFLAICLPLAMLGAFIFKRPIVASIVASVFTMIFTVIFRKSLPFHYWAHANDFIHEPLVRDRVVFDFGVSVMSLLFHLGVPLLVTCFAAGKFQWK